MEVVVHWYVYEVQEIFETFTYLVDEWSGILAQRFAKGVVTWNIVRIANQQISSKMEGQAGKTSVTNAKTAIES
jgi:hypothetical protein